MAYNKTSEERKWNYWKEQEEKKLRELGMEEEKIQKLRQMDREDFLEERRYREHLDETMQDMDSIKEKDSELFARDVKELLDHIGDKRIYELLKETEHDSHVSLQSIRDYLGHTYEEMTRQYIDYMPQRIAKANDEFFEMQGSSLASWLKKEEKDGK